MQTRRGGRPTPDTRRCIIKTRIVSPAPCPSKNFSKLLRKRSLPPRVPIRNIFFPSPNPEKLHFEVWVSVSFDISRKDLSQGFEMIQILRLLILSCLSPFHPRCPSSQIGVKSFSEMS